MVALAEKTEKKVLSIRASDVSGQKLVRFKGVALESTVGELVESLVPRMHLPRESGGRPLAYSARLEREGRQLHASEKIGDAVRPDDRIVLAPSIDAGAHTNVGPLV